MNEKKLFLNKQRSGPSFYQIWLAKSMASENFLKQVLQKHFHYLPDKAESKAKEIEDIGYVMCGTYPKDIAETKISETKRCTNNNGQFIKLIIQKEVVHVIRKS